jgi:hypothetical protein
VGGREIKALIIIHKVRARRVELYLRKFYGEFADWLCFDRFSEPAIALWSEGQFHSSLEIKLF